MKKHNKVILTGASLLTVGTITGYAASTAFQDLDAIRDNFDYILNLNTKKQGEIDGLNDTIADLNAQNTNKQNEINNLNTTITELNTKIEELEQTQNNSGKQQRIKELEEQVAGLIAERDRLETEHNNLKAEHDVLVAERDRLITELNGLEEENLELETAIKDLRMYTDQFVDAEAEE